MSRRQHSGFQPSAASSKILVLTCDSLLSIVRKFLLSIAIGLPLLLALLFAVLVYLLHQPVFVKGQLQRQLAAATGWHLQIAGDLALDWGKASVIEAHGLELSNPQWANPQWPEAGTLFTAEKLRLQFHPLALLRRKLDMRDVQLQGCAANLQRDAGGISNWALARQNDPDQPKDSGEPSFSWNLARLDVHACTLQIGSSGQQEPLEVRLDEVLLQVDGEQVLTASIKGAVDQAALSLQGNLSPLPALWEGGYLQHAIDLRAGEVKLHSEGSVADLHSGEDADLNFEFSGPEFALITRWLALPELSHGAFDARISVRKETGAGHMKIGIKADLGSLEMEGDGELDKLVAPSQGNLTLQIKGPDLEAMGRTLGVPGLLAQSFDVVLKAAIENSETQLEKLHFTSGPDSLQASGVLGPWPELRGSDIQVELQSTDLAAWLAHSLDQPLPISGFRSIIKLARDQKSELRLAASGEFGSRRSADNQAFTLHSQLIQDDQSIRLQHLELDVGQDSLRVSGDLVLGRELAGSELEADLQLVDMAATGKKWLGQNPGQGVGWKKLPARPLHLQAHLNWPGQGLKFSLAANQTSEQKLQLKGEIPDRRNPLAMNAQFDVQIPSLGLAQFLLPDIPLPDQPFTAQGRVVNDAQKHRTEVQDVNLRLGQTTARVQAGLQLENQLEGSTASWNLHSTDWRELWPHAPDALETGEITAAGTWRRSAGDDEFTSLQLRTPVAAVTGSGLISATAENPSQAAGGGRKMNFKLDISGDDASRLNPFLGPLFDSQPFGLQLTAAMESGRISSEDIHFRQGKTDLSAQLEVLLAERPVIRSKVRSALLDLTPLQQHVVAAQTEQPGHQAPRQPADQKLLFTDEAIDLVSDIGIDLSLDLAIEELLLDAYQFRQLSFGLELLPESLTVDDFEFHGGKGGHYAGQFSAQKRLDGTQFKLRARADDLKLGLIGKSGQDPDTLPPSDILLDLAGTGQTWHELAQTLTGTTRWYAGAGRISDTGLDFLFSDLLTQVFSTLNPLSQKSQFTQLSCGVFAADMLDGQVKLAPIVIQTDQITAFSEGQVDLSSEAIVMSFRTVPRKGLGISASSVVNPFFRIGGTLMKPALQLDVTKGAISGGAMVATAGLSVLFKSLSDRLLGSKDPCGDARAEIEKADKVKHP